MPEEAPVTAVAALRGRALRYAEVERPAHGAPRLRRLGTCDFDVDVEDAVMGPGSAEGLDAVGAALREVFRESAPRILAVIARPTTLVSFFSPLPEGLGAPARYEQLRQEAALLADVSSAQPVRIRAMPVRTEALPTGVHRWHHVVHVSETVHARLTLLARGLGAGTYDLHDSTQTAAAVAHALLDQELADGNPRDPARPFALAVGSYGDFAEFSLSRDPGAGDRPVWHFGLHAPSGAPEDAAYFALSMLQRLSVTPEEVGRLFVYGDDLDVDRLTVLGSLLGGDAIPLDPLPLFGRRPEGVDPAVLAAFAPCLGAVVR
jgi:hypothetical protein